MAKYSFFLFVILLLKIVHAIQSEFYSNDTTFEQINTTRITNTEGTLLDILDISEKPKLNAEPSILNTSASLYMEELYHFAVYSRPTKHFNIEQHRRTIEESDIVITFLIEDDDNMMDEKRDHGKNLSFNASKVHVDNIILKAQLRLYKENTNHSGNITVSLHQIYSDNNGEKTKSSVDELNVFHSYEGWLTFNITEVFAIWVVFSSLNRELYVSVRELHNSDRKIRPESVGIIFTSSTCKKNNNRQPFVTAFVKYGAKKSNSIIRRRRSSNTELPITTIDPNSNVFLPTRSESESSCQKQFLYVNFTDFNWNDWIIAPDGFFAYHCSGSCDYPLNPYVNLTNHSVVQSLVHLLNPKDAPKLCCTPSALRSLPILYFADNVSVQLSRYENMIVTDCGCF